MAFQRDDWNPRSNTDYLRFHEQTIYLVSAWPLILKNKMKFKYSCKENK